MQFEVPQFIEIEDKIVGPLTWKQFVYLAGGSGIIIVLFLNTSFLITIIFGVPIGALSASLAFHKINNRPFSIFLESFINYLLKSKLYLWRRETIQSIINTVSMPNLSNTGNSGISSLTHKLEQRNSHK